MAEVQKNLLERVRGELDWDRILERNRMVLCALSGGPDSIALCDLLQRLSGDLDFLLSAAHLNHGIRGEEADEDERFVREFCDTRRIRLEVEKVDIPQEACGSGESIEMAARRVRYEFLGRAAAKTEAGAVAIGHTADDRVENLLMRLLRGAGGRGLGSMQTVRIQGGLTFIRPLLTTSKQEILDYLGLRRLPHRIDITNLDLSTDRGRIRNHLLPELIRLAEDSGWSGVFESLARSADLLAEDESLIQGIVDEHLAEVLFDEEGGLHLPISSFGALPSPILARLILSSIERLDPDLRPEREHIECIIDMLRGSRTGACDIPGGIRAEPSGDAVIVRSPIEIQPPDPVEIAVSDLPATAAFGSRRIEIILSEGEKTRTQTGVESSQVGVIISVPKDCSSIVIRSARAGDRIAPLGMEGRTKKLSDIFIDRKVPRPRRPLEPIVECRPSGDIIAIPGLRMISEAVRVAKETERVMKIMMKGPVAASGGV